MTFKQVFECSLKLQVTGREKEAWLKWAPLSPSAVTNVQPDTQCVNVTWLMSAPHQCSTQEENIRVWSCLVPTAPQLASPTELCSGHDQELFLRLRYSSSQQTFSQAVTAWRLLWEPAACRQAWDSRASFPALWFSGGHE